MSSKDAYSVACLLTADNMEKLSKIAAHDQSTFSRVVNRALTMYFQERAELRPEQIYSTKAQ